MGYIKGLITGAVFGAAAALLLAPKKGDELREELKGKANKVKDRASTVSTAVGVAAIDLKDHGTDLVNSVVHHGAEIKDEATTALGEVKETLADAAGEVKAGVGDTIDDAKTTLASASDEAKEQVEGAKADAKDAVEQV